MDQKTTGIIICVIIAITAIPAFIRAIKILIILFKDKLQFMDFRRKMRNRK